MAGRDRLARSHVRIGLDASLASMLGSGTGRYATRLIRHLVALDEDNEYVLYFRSRGRSENPLLELRGPRLRSRITEAPLTLLRLHVNLPLWFRADGVDLYHSLGFFIPWLWRGKTVVMIHDLHPLLLSDHWWAPGNRISYLALRCHIPLALRRADRILTPSSYVKQTICDDFGIPPDRIVVTPHGVDPFFLESPSSEDMKAAEQRLGGERFFLYVGALAPHKNVAGLVRAFAELRAETRAQHVRLVLVGKPVGHYRDVTLIPLIRQLGLLEDVILTDYVEDTLLRALYRRAIALVLPSFGEGFGFPLLEAMASGTPIVTSPVSAMPEVAGEAALYADPREPGEIAAAMDRLLTDQSLRQALSTCGSVRASSFTWEGTAREVMRVYGEL